MQTVRIRPFKPHEGKKVVHVLRTSRDAIAVRRAEIVLRSAQGASAKEISCSLYFSADYMRKVIHRFNDDGIGSLRARYTNGGRPKKIQPEHESGLIELALTPPNLTGQPFTHWSIEKLREVAVRRRIIPEVSGETVRRILKAYHVSLQRTKTWKQSSDPEFEVKKTPPSGSTRRPRRAGKP